MAVYFAHHMASEFYLFLLNIARSCRILSSKDDAIIESRDFNVMIHIIIISVESPMVD